MTTTSDGGNMDTLRALAKSWGRMADSLVREPTFGKEARAYQDSKVLTLRWCEKQLVEALADLRAAK